MTSLTLRTWLASPRPSASSLKASKRAAVAYPARTATEVAHFGRGQRQAALGPAMRTSSTSACDPAAQVRDAFTFSSPRRSVAVKVVSWRPRHAGSGGPTPAHRVAGRRDPDHLDRPAPLRPAPSRDSRPRSWSPRHDGHEPKGILGGTNARVVDSAEVPFKVWAGEPGARRCSMLMAVDPV